MFAWLELRTHCHATEDEAKVAKALEFLCPSSRPLTDKTEGYLKNPILVLTSWTDKGSAIRDFWQLMSRAGLVDKIMSMSNKTIDDNGIMHIRLDKQEAYQGKAVLADHEDVVVVRLKIVRIPSNKQSPLEIAKENISKLANYHVPE